MLKFHHEQKFVKILFAIYVDVELLQQKVLDNVHIVPISFT